ncbi:transcriptional regulator, MarR family [Pseudodesulfovibrio mercurii]|uniref:Transcriptional regulator, MarR family n=1 Tax=Pseudodesulfovibrio mercurii TaxID=641491 RepID=F0JC49_9BACT|nr:MarR family transcriptional regulator [Pseudodesulfovibrio mercurii]EGB15622.1 transcriptional regulator, MarR family [Pseudodesulfovibrio mercurii]
MSPAQPATNAELAGLFRLASRLMARAGHRRDLAHHAQHQVLSILLENGPMPQGELLEILDVRSSSLSELLRKLEDRGLILRERNEEDRRSFIISPTDQARALDTDGNGTDADNQFDCLDQAERDQLRTILGKLVNSLREDPAACGPGNGRGFGPGRGGRGGPGGPGKGFGKGRGRGNGFGRGRGGR